MSIVEEIKQSRIVLLTKEQKEGILQSVKEQMKYKESALIFGAAHFGNQIWKFANGKCNDCQAPYKYHSAISEWLRAIGFKTQRYYNRLGVDQGLEVWI